MDRGRGNEIGTIYHPPFRPTKATRRLWTKRNNNIKLKLTTMRKKPFRISASKNIVLRIIVITLACCLTGSWASTDGRASESQSASTRSIAFDNTFERELIEDDSTATTTTTTTIAPSTTAPSQHSKPPPKTEEHDIARDEDDIDSSTSVDGGIGDEDSERVGKLSSAVFITSTATTNLDSSHHGLLSLIFIALCAGLFIAGIPSSITQCHCFENMCADSNDKHQLHGSVKERMNAFNHLVGGNKKTSSSGGSYSPSGFTSALTNEEGDELGEEGTEVDEKRGIDPKPRRSIGSRLFGAARIQKLPRSPLRREKKNRQKEIITNDDVVVTDMYVRAEDGQVKFQKV